MKVAVNGKEVGKLATCLKPVDKNVPNFKEVEYKVHLNARENQVKMYSPLTMIPAVDCFYLEKL